MIRAAMRPARTLFWASSALIVYTHAGYPALLWLLARGRREQVPEAAAPEPPPVTFVVAAYDEEDVIERKVENVLALDYPRDRLELIVASDGSTDRTVERARGAGADLVLDLPRGGKVRAQDQAVERASGEIVAFSDANATLAPDSLRRLVRRFADPDVGYVCGQVRFTSEDGSNQEGVYWRYEMAIRELESAVGDVTAGNGALYATRRDSYVVVDPRMGHDLSFPFNMVKRGWRAKYEPGAAASEKTTPSSETEFRRKRRMMSHTWPIMLAGGILSPRGYSPLYALQIFSHRLLRYLTPFLHAIAFLTSVRLRYRWALLPQLALAAAAVIGRPRIARYYVLVTASPAAGLWDYLRTGTPAGWEKAEGTR